MVSKFQLSQQIACACEAIVAELYEFSVSPTLRFAKVPLNWSAAIQGVNLFPHSCASPQDFSREHTVSSTRLLKIIFNHASPRTDPWCTKLLTKYHLDIKRFINILWKIELTNFQTFYLPFHSVTSCFVGGEINLQTISDRGHY